MSIGVIHEEVLSFSIAKKKVSGSLRLLFHSPFHSVVRFFTFLFSFLVCFCSHSPSLANTSDIDESVVFVVILAAGIRDGSS